MKGQQGFRLPGPGQPAASFKRLIIGKNPNHRAVRAGINRQAKLPALIDKRGFARTFQVIHHEQKHLAAVVRNANGRGLGRRKSSQNHARCDQ